MNAILVDRWNTRVKPGDFVWYLGDFSLGKNWVTEVGPRLNGEIHLVAGNHDWVHPCRTKPNKMAQAMELYLSVFKTVQLEARIEIDGVPVLLHHMPPFVEVEGYDVRYKEFRPQDEGWILHGHVHEKWKTKDKWINVGVDVWEMSPVHESQIIEIIRGGK
jgi:calcineurin-like phosphoesterase family protein